MLLCFCKGLKKTEFTYTFKDLNQEWLDTALGLNWDTKTSYGKEIVQCIVNLQDVVFKHQELFALKHNIIHCHKSYFLFGGLTGISLFDKLLYAN